MKNYYMWGWHGCLNTGDDAFAVVTTWGLRKYANANQIIIDSDISQVLSKRYKISLVYNNKLKFPGLGRLSRIYYRSICQNFILAGGSLLENEDVINKLHHDFHWQKSDRKTFAIGLSVGPFKSSKHEKATLEYLNQMSFIGFRDNYSYKWACTQNLQAPFKKTFDLAVLLPAFKNYPSNIIFKDKVIGISLLAFNELKDKNTLVNDLNFVQSFAKITYAIAIDKGFKINLYSLCRNPYSNDDIMCKIFKESVPDDSIIKIYQHDGDAYKTLIAMQECSHFISMRLHGAIFSYIHQIPLLFLKYHPKCQSFAETVGLDQKLCLDIANFDQHQYGEILNCLLSESQLNSSLSLFSAQQLALLNFEGLLQYI